MEIYPEKKMDLIFRIPERIISHNPRYPGASADDRDPGVYLQDRVNKNTEQVRNKKQSRESQLSQVPLHFASEEQEKIEVKKNMPEIGMQKKGTERIKPVMVVPRPWNEAPILYDNMAV